MRKVVISMAVSVDGYVNALGGEFAPPAWSEDMDRWTEYLRERCDTLIFGRNTWEMMIRHWPTAEVAADTPEPQREVAKFMNNSRKLVFSRTQPDMSAWKNSVLAKGNVADAIKVEKAREGKDLAILGSPQMAQTAMRSDVIDEYWLLTMPVLLGGGSRLFDGHALRRKLKLLETRALDTGAIFTRYERVSGA
ncbi:dihydrofolate reductase family protein [Qingshengfaniella alkalisoli]|uniref:Bacterial bifunctional deaminase-reductase C-terminal domain-containing protein n=1 Tax=Qingshengfaniella alkalisoli TaxID=2599296 RepID=A0A5B8IV29_9RHOB|nr:dihydrofolate reductase family protein [Qingshengfaniella alkalisoli]QDY69972.1 hypothetical protein FPZ52_10325 [Qingshengfaniella alkalisoli]